MTETDTKTPQTHIRWLCSECEYEDTRERPSSVMKLKSEVEASTCPQCDGSSTFVPFPFLHNKIQKSRSDGQLANVQPTTVSGETVEDALNGHEVGTHLSQGHQMVDPPDDPHACVCDWCESAIYPDETATAFAYRHPKHDDPDGWTLYELYCEECDVASLLLGGSLTDDVIVHGHISQWGYMFTLTDTAVIHRRRIGESIELTPQQGGDK